MPTRWPDLAVLELLSAIGEHGSLGAAARAVGMAQPNASRAIATLERNLGLSLVERHPRGSRLTADGVVVAELAARLVDGAGELLATSRALRERHEARLDLAASLTVAEYLLPAWIAGLRHAHPELDVRVRVENSTQVFDLLADRAIDLGFVESPSVPRGLHSRAVARDRLVVVVAPSHPWTRRTHVTAHELATTPLVSREPGSGTRSTLAEALGAGGVGGAGVPELSRPAMVVSSNAAVLISAASGAGPAVLSELAVRPWVARGELVEVPVEGLDLRRRLRAVWRGGEPLAAPAAALLGELQG
ncbi:LysR family transcriptional regulator [Agromyces sp. H3Y2-19a]|uniref:LysR family transcriptional regulator n=1 Tax=Agromyces chromiiresistens TaxID=3030835 RepID=UPI0023B99953|nr:LysR family transcriptional regulator [Agromyces chromiiresistens]MDF0512262.1 LysR family transcriptional regulator [Agromyces chromiiresistens]